MQCLDSQTQTIKFFIIDQTPSKSFALASFQSPETVTSMRKREIRLTGMKPGPRSQKGSLKIQPLKLSFSRAQKE